MKKILILGMVMSLFIGSSDVLACSPPAPRTPEQEIQDLKDQISTTNVIFVGKVVEVYLVPQLPGNDTQQTYGIKFKVDRYWKGVSQSEMITFVTKDINTVPGMCPVFIPVLNNVYLVYGNNVSGSNSQFNIIGFPIVTKLLSSAQKDLELLGSASYFEGPNPEVHTYNFTRTLKLGMKGQDVLFLQKKLNQLGFKISNSGVGSPGNESNHFGIKTKRALIKYQDAHLQEIGISRGNGIFGPATRLIMGPYLY